MGMLAKIRRMYFRDKLSLREIATIAPAATFVPTMAIAPGIGQNKAVTSFCALSDACPSRSAAGTWLTEVAQWAWQGGFVLYSHAERGFGFPILFILCSARHYDRTSLNDLIVTVFG